MRNSYLQLMKTAWQYAGHEKRRIVFMYSVFIINCIIGSLDPLLYGWFIGAVQNDGLEAIRYAWIYVGLHYVLQLLHGATHYPLRLVERQLAFNVSRNFLDELYRRLLHLPVTWHQDHHSGATISRVRRAQTALRDFFSDGFVYFQTIFNFITAFGVMVYFSPVFGLLALGLGMAAIGVLLTLDKPYIKSIEDINEGENTVATTIADGLSNVKTVITLRLERIIHKDLLDKVQAVSPLFRRNTVINNWKWFISGFLVKSIYCAMIIGYIYNNSTPGVALQLGGLVIMLGYVYQFTGAFYSITFQYNQVIQHNTNVKSVKEIWEAYQQLHRPGAQTPLPADWRAVEIKHLNFSYQEADQHPAPAPAAPQTVSTGEPTTLALVPQRFPGLQDLNLHFKRGQRIAFIGESGGGKSTLMGLLRGLYFPQQPVQIMVDGKPVSEWGNIADMVTLIPQDPEIFENTIAYNITLGLPFSEEEIMEACDIACFTPVVKQLPRGLDSLIQEKGVNLSGGQKQRLALARGVLACRNSNIVLMDEPTSSVDPKTQVEIYKNLFHLLTDKVVIASLHQLNLLNLFDYVYVFHQGRIVEEGTHTELSLATVAHGDRAPLPSE